MPWAEFEGAFLAVAAADWDQAGAAIEKAIEINRQGGYPHQQAWFVAHLGWLARLRGDQEAAVRLGRQSLELAARHEHSWWEAAACAMLGGTVLLGGDPAGAVALFERGLAAAQHSGLEAYLLRTAAPLAAVTGSRAMLGEAAGLLERASIPGDGAWMLGYEAYLSLAQAWLAHGEPDRASAVLAPLLAVAEREPWRPALAAALAVSGAALIRLDQRDQARVQLDRAAGLAAERGLPHVLRDAREALGQLG
jgi:tetratricopeptide (TPR) repeat protein